MDCTSPVFGIYPCGKCLNCRARSRQEWVFRLRMEYKSSNFGLFVTLTYSDEHLPLDGVCKRDIQLFLKRLRKNFNSQALRYFIVSEYGDHTFRPHYHALLFFNFDRNNDIYDIIEQAWSLGNVQFGEIEEGSIVYCTKYCLKGSIVPPGQNENFRLLSKMHGGVGSSYLEFQTDFHDLSSPSLVRYQGDQAPMPRYFREKMLQKLDEDDRINTRLQYAENVRIHREKRNEAELLRFKRLHPELNFKQLEDAYYSWKYECHERKQELVLKRTKKQNLW